jgi:ParB family transcriptional regulator, chromosome partitioning protein
LSSLISVSELSVEAEAGPAALEVRPPASTPTVATGATEIPVEAIRPNPHQPRKQFDEAGILALAASIKSTGLVQPIIVRSDGAGDYQLIAGERRLRAAKAAGLTTIPALLRDADAFKQAQMALIENIQRQDLNPIERAQAYRAIMDQLGLTQAELAQRLGEDRPSIANHLRLLDLTESVQNLVRDGKLSLGHAKILAGISDPAHQAELAERIVGQDLSVRNLERMVSAEAESAAASAPTVAPSAHIRDLEQTITSQLGLRVQLRTTGDKTKGRLIIHYASLDQFDRVLELLGVRTE